MKNLTPVVHSAKEQSCICQKDTSWKNGQMLLGLETISWGRIPANIEEIVNLASRLGFRGLEFAQLPCILGSVEDLCDLLKSRNLVPIGIACGASAQIVEYARKLNVEYICITEWNEDVVKAAFDSGIRVGIHPHLYKDIETMADAEVYLNRYPKLEIVFDTAHLYLAGEDIVKCFETYQNRIISVHLKDWSRKFGRSPYHFARGFTSLGKGHLEDELNRLLEKARDTKFPGWFIVEEDSPSSAPANCIETSCKWLQNHVSY